MLFKGRKKGYEVYGVDKACLKEIDTLLEEGSKYVTSDDKADFDLICEKRKLVEVTGNENLYELDKTILACLEDLVISLKANNASKTESLITKILGVFSFRIDNN